MTLASINRPGIALLEAVAALALLTIAGSALFGIALQGATTVAQIHAREMDLLDAHAVLSRMSIMTREQLATVPSRLSGGQQIEVLNVTPALVLITVRDSATGAVLLHTMTYFPEE